MGEEWIEEDQWCPATREPLPPMPPMQATLSYASDLAFDVASYASYVSTYALIRTVSL